MSVPIEPSSEEILEFAQTLIDPPAESVSPNLVLGEDEPLEPANGYEPAEEAPAEDAPDADVANDTDSSSTNYVVTEKSTLKLEQILFDDSGLEANETLNSLIQSLMGE
jgi:hypothetical protein